MPEPEPSVAVSADLEDGETVTRDQLLSQLRWMALSQFSKEHTGHTLQPTAVVHEAWIRIAAKVGDSWDDEADFRQWAGRIVRQVLVDHARKRNAQKRDVRRRTHFIDAPAEQGPTPENILTLSALLEELEAVQPRMAAVVEMRYFGGMRDVDIAKRLGISDRVVRSDWKAARAWLFGRMYEE